MLLYPHDVEKNSIIAGSTSFFTYDPSFNVGRTPLTIPVLRFSEKRQVRHARQQADSLLDLAVKVLAACCTGAAAPEDFCTINNAKIPIVRSVCFRSLQGKKPPKRRFLEVLCAKRNKLLAKY
jgi:hypothetical protein